MCDYYAQVEPESTCRTSDLPAGQLVELVHPDGSGAAAVAIHERSVVHVESLTGTLGSGPQARNPDHLPLDTVARLATDPRLRW